MRVHPSSRSRLRLNAALPFRRAPALVIVVQPLQIGRIRGMCLLLDLQKQRVVLPVAGHEHHVVAQTDAAGPHYFEGYVQRTEEIEQVEPLPSPTIPG